MKNKHHQCNKMTQFINICAKDQGCQARDLNRNIVRSHAFSTTDRAGALQRSPESPDR
jgi:hypothetical protein